MGSRESKEWTTVRITRGTYDRLNELRGGMTWSDYLDHLSRKEIWRRGMG